MITPYAPRPVRNPVMFQSWRRLTFLHWRYPADAIRKLLPQQVALDTFDGAAWVGLTPFLLANLHPPFLAPFPWISHFPETNVRTYVTGPDGEPGVWFFTLEAGRLAAVLGARTLYRLPYRWSDMRVSVRGRETRYWSARKWPFGCGATDIVVESGDPIAPGEFDHFLTARYRLYTNIGTKLAFAQIEHAPWPLRSARVLRLGQTLVEESGVPRPCGEPVVHYSEDIRVRIGTLEIP
ncbi:MAG TPA: DUF2071 domain-containing protein [Bryobacteraceae bacterium]|nr:DUF2071 domain-containing protein [Bryobacteraceae bacterium]